MNEIDFDSKEFFCRRIKASENDARKQRGLEIAALCKLGRKGRNWIVPSQSGDGKYTVEPDAHEPHCDCPDHQTRRLKCKHIYAVEFAMKRETNPDGTITETVTETVVEAVAVQKVTKRTYPQVWKAYNAAQTHEKEKFLDLLRDLCEGCYVSF